MFSRFSRVVSTLFMHHWYGTNKLLSTPFLPILLYGSDCWTISKTDARKIDALDQWCLCMLLGIKWYQFVRNDDVRRLTKQPKLTAIIQSCRLTLFGHIVYSAQLLHKKRYYNPIIFQCICLSLHYSGQVFLLTVTIFSSRACIIYCQSSFTQCLMSL